jgi:RecB family exonuclease
MLAKLIEWLRGSRGELSLVDVERDFDVVVGEVRLRGRVDRLERDEAGRAVVIDLKTGKSKSDDPVGNPQLGAYQLAVEAGAFGDDVHPGGARLVQIGTNHKAVVDQAQPPLAESEDPGWIAERVAHVAGRLRGSEFSATVNSYCGACDVKSSCPLMSEGRQVTG